MKINTYLYKNCILEEKHLNIEATYDKNRHTISFLEKDVEVIVYFDKNNIQYQRKQESHNLNLKLIDNMCYLYIPELGKDLDIKILKSSYEYENNAIKIEYCLETEKEVTNKIVIELESDNL